VASSVGKPEAYVMVSITTDKPVSDGCMPHKKPWWHACRFKE
jgi:hypothetical protein